MSSTRDMSDSEESHVEDEDEETVSFRSQLSTLSFEELQKLKEKLGAKVYKEALFGKNEKHTNKPQLFKRENKNRPREMSSKKPKPVRNNVKPVQEKEIRDPRFDPLCGAFDKKQFSENYNFLSDLRIKDIKAIRAELKKTEDPDRKLQLKRLLQRLNDQHKDGKLKSLEKEKVVKEKQEVEQHFKEGRQPHFKNKSERRVESLVQQYEELKKEGAGRIQRHIKRRQQKLKKRSHKAPTGFDD